LELGQSNLDSGVYHLSESEEKALKEGLECIEKGEIVPHSEVKKMYGKWL
jgi:predicted transcriptional regulator